MVSQTADNPVPRPGDALAEAIAVWAAEAEVRFVAHEGRTAAFFVDRLPIWFQGDNLDRASIWFNWADVAHIAEWTNEEVATAWALVAEIDGLAEIKTDGATRLVLVEGYPATIALASIGKHAEKVSNALGPTFARALVGSGLGQALTVHKATVNADGTVTLGPETTLADAVGPAPSAEVADHALRQGIHALPDPRANDLIAIDVTQVLGEVDR